ncbi:MAG: DNA polymerase III subunit delta [Alistipes senegalensis]
MRFADIIGQDDLKRHLAQSVDAGRASHAQLFTGLSGSGALALAVAYVQYLCCRHRRDGDSCVECPDCKQIASLAHPDLHLVFPLPTNRARSPARRCGATSSRLCSARCSTNGAAMFRRRTGTTGSTWARRFKGMIAAREADEINRKLSFKSFEADYKTMLIWLPEAIERGGCQQDPQNPPKSLWERTLFIRRPPINLTSSSPTIISRTQEVCVPAHSPRRTRQRVRWVEASVPDPLQARNMARLAGGDLLELNHLVAGESDALRKENFDLFCGLMRLSYNDKHLELVSRAEDAAQLSREQQRAFLRDAARLLREESAPCGHPRNQLPLGEELAFCSKFAPFVGSQNIEPLIAEIESASAQFRRRTATRRSFSPILPSR